MAVGTSVERAFRLIRNMVLARLLSPEDFGLMAIVLAVLMVLESFTELGIQQSIVHNKNGGSYEYLNMAWWLQSLRGICLLIIAFFIAPLICKVYDNPELLWLLRLAFLSNLFFNLCSTRLFVLEKEFKFGKAVLLKQGVTLVSNIFTILLAFYYKNVWVLVIGKTIEGSLCLVFSFLFCPFRPSFKFNKKYFSELITYSRGMFGLSILTILAIQIDVFVLGKVMSSEKVGMYILALNLSVQPVFLFSQTIGRTLLPAFSEKQDDKNALCSIVIRITKYLWIIGIPLLLSVLFFSKTILSIVYGNRYSQVALPFVILCCVAFIRIHGVVLSNVYFAIGKPNLHRKFVIILALMIITFIYPSIYFGGLEGAAGLLLFANTVAILLQVSWLRKQIDLSFKEYFLCWIPKFSKEVSKKPLALIG